MLVSLSIRDVVLIDRLDLSFEAGLCVLTGETGAGKSIMLDALGLALGGRAEARLVRPEAERAIVSAGFELPADHPAFAVLEDSGLAGEDGMILLRRQLGRDGRSRGFVNDQPISIALLRQLGDLLVEVQGQFEQRGLLDQSTHGPLLDAYGGLLAKSRAVAERWQAWRDALAAERSASDSLAAAKREEAFLRHAVGELDDLNPQPDEIQHLAEQRELLRHREKILEALDLAAGGLAGNDSLPGAEDGLASALAALERVRDSAGERLTPAIDSLARALAEAEEARAQITQASSDLMSDEGDLASIETRFFQIKDLARKHGVADNALAALRDELSEKLAGLDDSGDRLAALAEAVTQARDHYLEAARALSAGRKAACKRLDRAINGELPALKLDKAKFRTALHPLDETGWSSLGLERVAFEISTAPNLPAGPLVKVASGGELARVLLALKVALATIGPKKTLVFDEVDNGVGGATAHAVGERLERLAENQQVLVITHSPQVAARGAHHWCVRKEAQGKGLATRVGQINDQERREEIARMLSGAEVTEEARAAADRLMGAA